MPIVARGGVNAGTTDDPLTGRNVGGERTPLDCVQSMNAPGNSSREGQECSGRTDSEQSALARFRCRFCGNLVAREEPPTRCYVCRRGENEPPETRLYEPLIGTEKRLATDGGKTQLGFVVPDELCERLDAIRYERTEPSDIVTRSELLRDALRLWLDEVEEDDEGDDDRVDEDERRNGRVDEDGDGDDEDGDGDDEGDGDRVDEDGDGNDGPDGDGVTMVSEADEEVGHEEAHEYVDRVREARKEE